ncbi:hypothetical protein SASPL_133839 [Salvia splendens]|uniref:Uncharacterized protein n=1 Tax=Salvia splendens TaxID=180675 RepID=A0A8X8X3S6_SALSN|nr:hypothetical protein SASPL_133839 [Salvia splendens]
MTNIRNPPEAFITSCVLPFTVPVCISMTNKHLNLEMIPLGLKPNQANETVKLEYNRIEGNFRMSMNEGQGWTTFLDLFLQFMLDAAFKWKDPGCFLCLASRAIVLGVEKGSHLLLTAGTTWHDLLSLPNKITVALEANLEQCKRAIE